MALLNIVPCSECVFHAMFYMRYQLTVDDKENIDWIRAALGMTGLILFSFARK